MSFVLHHITKLFFFGILNIINNYKMFNGHTSYVLSVEYSLFVINNIKIVVIQIDNTTRSWDIRSNKNQLYVIKGDDEDDGIICFKFLHSKIEILNIFSSYILEDNPKRKKKVKRMSLINEKETSTQLALVNFISKENIQAIIQYWIRVLKIKLGWIHDFDKLVVNYATVFMFETFRSSSKLLTIFRGHTNWVKSIDYSAFNDCQFLCSGSNDKTIRVWDIENSKQIQLFEGHSNSINCVKFSSYHYHNYRQNVVCSSSEDKTIRFWDIKDNRQVKIFNEHTGSIYSIEFSPFNGGRYLCSGSLDKTIRLLDVETYKSLHVFNGHENGVLCVGISPLQSNNNNDNNNK
ncbi:WD-40 repeat-containing protein, partial [Reticulomyxa filosa]